MQISESVPLAGSYLWFSREAPGSSPWTSCRSVSLHGPRCSQDSLVHSSPPPLWLMVSCRGFSRGLWGPQEWQSHRKGRFWVPDLTALMRTAPWPGTPVETLYEWKRNFCCVCWSSCLIRLLYLPLFSEQPWERSGAWETIRVRRAMSLHAAELLFPWWSSSCHGFPEYPFLVLSPKFPLFSDSCLVPTAAYFLPS